MDGFDLSRHRFKRWFLAKRMFRYTLRYGIPTDSTVDPNLNPPPHVDLDEAMDGLARALERYQGYVGPLKAHPLFGRLSRDRWDHLHCFHCAHHLSFAIPAEG